jgi:hypothetical protein
MRRGSRSNLVCDDPRFESVADRETASVALVTAPVAPEPPLVTLPVRSGTTVVEATVEIAEVTVRIGSSCAPAITAPLDSPPSASTTKHRARRAVDPISLRVPSS